jgi:hypothetical protein
MAALLREVHDREHKRRSNRSVQKTAKKTHSARASVPPAGKRVSEDEGDHAEADQAA